MKVIYLYKKNSYVETAPINLCLGYFDGVHMGHTLLIEKAREKNVKVGVLTFDKPTSLFLKNNKTSSCITSLKDKIDIFEKLNVDYMFVLKMDENILNFSIKEFIEEILKKININQIFVGEDYKFAKNRLGDPNCLKKHYVTNIVQLLKIDDKKISSSFIKELIIKGSIEEANEFLKYNYTLKGKVVEGNKIGKTISFPTANIQLDDNYVLPKNGVYKSNIFIGEKMYPSITNIGVHPTVLQSDYPIIEVHILNFNEDIYGQNVKVELLKFIRDEKYFDNMEQLKLQILHDIKKCL